MAWPPIIDNSKRIILPAIVRTVAVVALLFDISLVGIFIYENSLANFLNFTLSNILSGDYFHFYLFNTILRSTLALLGVCIKSRQLEDGSRLLASRILILLNCTLTLLLLLMHLSLPLFVDFNIFWVLLFIHEASQAVFSALYIHYCFNWSCRPRTMKEQVVQC